IFVIFGGYSNSGFHRGLRPKIDNRCSCSYVLRFYLDGSVGRLVTSHSNFYLAIHNQIAHRANTRGRMFSKNVFKDFIEGLEIARVSEYDRDMNNILQPITGVFHDFYAVINRQTRLLNNTALNHFTIEHGRLTGYIEPASSGYRA